MVASTNLSMTFPFINMGKYEEADVIIREVFDYAKKYKDDLIKARANLRLGYKESAVGNLDKALAAYLESYDYYQDKKQNHELGDIINRLGSTYKDIGDCATALRYWENHINEVKIKKAEGKFVIPIKSNMIECYLKEKNYDRAKQLSYEVINSRKKSNSYKMLSGAYVRLSNLYLLEYKYHDALKNIDTAYQYALLFGNGKIKSNVLLERATILSQLNRKKEAISDLEKALALAIKSNTSKSEMKAYRKLSEINYELKNLDLAYIYDQKSDSIYHKMFSADVSASIKNLEKEIIQKNSDDEIALLENQNKLKNENLQQQKNINRIGLVLLIVLGLLLLLFSYLIFIRTKNNKILKEKNATIENSLSVNKMLVKEIHHRVKNNLQIVASLLGLQSRFAIDKNVHEAVVASKTRVQAMSLLHQSLYKNEDLKTIPIKKYFEDLCENLSSTYSLMDQNIKLKTMVQDLYLDLDQVVTLGLIINEFITNSIKHAFVDRVAGTITLEIKSAGNKLNCSIKDDGIGIPFTTLPKKSLSMGMQLISSFLNKLDAEIQINNTSGTEINLSFLIENNEKG